MQIEEVFELLRQRSGMGLSGRVAIEMESRDMITVTLTPAPGRPWSCMITRMEMENADELRLAFVVVADKARAAFESAGLLKKVITE